MVNKSPGIAKFLKIQISIPYLLPMKKGIIDRNRQIYIALILYLIVLGPKISGENKA